MKNGLMVEARLIAIIAGATLSLGASAPVHFTDLATPFEPVATETTNQPERERIAAVRQTPPSKCCYSSSLP